MAFPLAGCSQGDPAGEPVPAPQGPIADTGVGKKPKAPSPKLQRPAE